MSSMVGAGGSGRSASGPEGGLLRAERGDWGLGSPAARESATDLFFAGDSRPAGLEGAPWWAHRSYRAHLQSRGSARS